MIPKSRPQYHANGGVNATIVVAKCALEYIQAIGVSTLRTKME